jgi:predicted dehydrogenase
MHRSVEERRSDNDLAVGLVGAGYWGSKLARNIFEAEGCRLQAVCEVDPARLADTASRYPACRAVTDFDEILGADDLEAVVLATPASSHHGHCRAVLEAGKHVLVEKPLALSSTHCEELIALAQANQRVLMVGHTFMYSEPVRMLRSLLQAGELGDPLYLYSQRVNLGVIHDDVKALWDFGPHDVSIILYLLGATPTRVSARQFSVLNRPHEDIAFLVLEFESGVVAHVHESWLDPRKIRQFTVVGSRKMAVYDDTDFEAPLRVYDKGVELETGDEEDSTFAGFSAGEGYGEFKLRIRAGDVVMPRVPPREPLRTEVEHFVSCVADGTEPVTSARHGARVVAVLEAAERSASENGAAVLVESTSPAAVRA